MAIAQLHAMSDHLLRDIGLTRSEIAATVKYKVGSEKSPAGPKARITPVAAHNKPVINRTIQPSPAATKESSAVG
jgi:hypothetical protein